MEEMIKKQIHLRRRQHRSPRYEPGGGALRVQPDGI